MSRNYSSAREIRRNVSGLDQWASSRETHPAVACAIHAIADHRRTATAIWEAPTDAEVDHVKMAVEEYVREGDFSAEDDGRYPWGLETVVLEPEAN